MINKFKTGFAMKLIGAAVFAVIVCLLATCLADLESPGSEGTPNVWYSTDGSQLSIGINGRSVARAADSSRALTRNQAISSYDYFEVVFFDGVSNYVRAQWKRGDAINITGVTEDVDYKSATNAILFAGREQDKTLLAVGLLTGSTDRLGIAVTGNEATTITVNTASVTFSLVALTTSLSRDAAATNGFAVSDGTNLVATTLVKTLSLDTGSSGIVNIPYFPLTRGQTAIAATYTFGVTGSAGAADFADYTPGIIVAGAGATAEPQYPPTAIIGGGGTVSLDGATALSSVSPNFITFTNNNAAAVTAGTAFVPAVAMTINTTDSNTAGINATDGYVAFYLQVPVRAITNINTNLPGGITWYIKTAIGSNQLYLDDGLVGVNSSSAGGAVLLGVGNVTTTPGFTVNGQF